MFQRILISEDAFWEGVNFTLQMNFNFNLIFHYRDSQLLLAKVKYRTLFSKQTSLTFCILGFFKCIQSQTVFLLNICCHFLQNSISQNLKSGLCMKWRCYFYMVDGFFKFKTIFEFVSLKIYDFQIVLLFENIFFYFIVHRRWLSFSNLYIQQNSQV